jgi:hypothetical protein
MENDSGQTPGILQASLLTNFSDKLRRAAGAVRLLGNVGGKLGANG